MRGRGTAFARGRKRRPPEDIFASISFRKDQRPAATSREEIGNPPHRGTVRKLRVTRRDVADPWRIGDFDAAYRDVLAGCEGLLASIDGGAFDFGQPCEAPVIRP